MGRILFFLILGFLFWLVVRVLLKQRPPQERADASSAQKKATPPQLTMSQCAYCGVHFPAAEAVQAADGRQYCTQAHHDQALRDPRTHQTHVHGD